MVLKLLGRFKNEFRVAWVEFSSPPNPLLSGVQVKERLKEKKGL